MTDANLQLTRTFAVVASKIKPQPRFVPIRLPPRQQDQKDGKPALAFTTAEFQAGAKRSNYSTVAKFAVGKPSLANIQKAFRSIWNIKWRAIISESWDSRHVLVILDSKDNVTTALASPLREVGHALLCLFRWTQKGNQRLRQYGYDYQGYLWLCMTKPSLVRLHQPLVNLLTLMVVSSLSFAEICQSVCWACAHTFYFEWGIDSYGQKWWTLARHIGGK